MSQFHPIRCSCCALGRVSRYPWENHDTELITLAAPPNYMLWESSIPFNGAPEREIVREARTTLPFTIRIGACMTS